MSADTLLSLSHSPYNNVSPTRSRSVLFLKLRNPRLAFHLMTRKVTSKLRACLTFSLPTVGHAFGTCSKRSQGWMGNMRRGAPLDLHSSTRSSPSNVPHYLPQPTYSPHSRPNYSLGVLAGLITVPFIFAFPWQEECHATTPGTKRCARPQKK